MGKIEPRDVRATIELGRAGACGGAWALIQVEARGNGTATADISFVRDSKAITLVFSSEQLKELRALLDQAQEELDNTARRFTLPPGRQSF